MLKQERGLQFLILRVRCILAKDGHGEYLLPEANSQRLERCNFEYIQAFSIPIDLQLR